jgi:hypothetical protein
VQHDGAGPTVQLLQNAGLVMERSYKVGRSSYAQWLNGLVTTRRGRSALDRGTVAEIISATYSSAA